MIVAQLGNFGPPHSTENHLATALENNGHTVQRWQENDLVTWETLGELPKTDVDFILWTRTGWDWNSLGVTEAWAHTRMRRMMRFARASHIPVVGVHLDIWFGLERAHQVDTEPFFEVDLLCTADGGHPEEWAKRGIHHVFMPPGVSRNETEPGMYRSDLASPIAFVGSWQGHYHKESEHRHALVQWLKQNFTRDCAFWPQLGQPAIRGADLRDLYASIGCAVGDSCFTGTGLPLYHSDRIPETVGRGAYLIHPRIPGLEEYYEHRVHMANWNAWEWDGLGAEIEFALTNPAEVKEIARAGREHVLKTATYEVRMDQLIALLHQRDLLDPPEQPIKPAKAKKTVAKKAAK